MTILTMSAAKKPENQDNSKFLRKGNLKQKYRISMLAVENLCSILLSEFFKNIITG